MSFGREKRIILGVLALLAPVPLPFNEVLEWPFLFLYLLGATLFLRRAHQDPPGWLPVWAMNLLGLAYLPVFFFDLTIFGRGQLVRPVVHLALFAVLVKLFSLRRERDKWQVLIGIYFLFLAAMATSVHLTVILYLVAFLTVSLLAFIRFGYLHVLRSFGLEDPAPYRAPLKGFLATSTVAAVILAVPLFALLPRVRAPFIVGRGTGTGTTVHASGFTDEVTLDTIGRVRTNRAVVMRLEYGDPPSPNGEMRFKAATYEHFRQGVWRAARERPTYLRLASQGQYHLAPGEPINWVTIWLRPLHSQSLILPVEALRLEIRSLGLEVSRGGALSLRNLPLEPLEYRVGLAPDPVLLAGEPDTGAEEPTLDLRGLTPRIAALAAEVGGEGGPRERARRLERHLIQSYEYTLDFVGRRSEEPLEDFLFRYRSGHCEYFASAMVLMLRAQGIPARLVTGFLGGEYNAWEGTFVVRQRNAHAWVEAYLPGEGWRIFDPTPPAGRPASEPQSLLLLASQAYDFLLHYWDRYVLTYGFYDQLRFFAVLRSLWVNFWRQFGQTAPEPGLSPSVLPVAAEEAPEPVAGVDVLGWSPWVVGALVLVLVAVAGALIRRHRAGLTATRAYRIFRHHLARAGVPVRASVAPLALREAAVHLYPQTAGSAARLIDLYLEESFGGRRLEADQRAYLRQALRDIKQATRRTR